MIKVKLHSVRLNKASLIEVFGRKRNRIEKPGAGVANILMEDGANLLTESDNVFLLESNIQQLYL